MPNYDPAIMDKLLNQPDLKQQVEAMAPEELEWFKELLVSQGIYAQFVKEQGRK